MPVAWWVVSSGIGLVGATIGWFGNDVADALGGNEPPTVTQNWFDKLQDSVYNNIDFRTWILLVGGSYIYLNRHRKKQVNVYKKKADWNKLYSAYKF